MNPTRTDDGRNALKRPVRDVMQPDVIWFPTDTPLKEAARRLAELQISGAPVCTADGRVVGMISKTDLTESFGPEYEAGVISDAMTPKVLAVGPDDSVERAIHVMVFERIHRVLVVDTQGALVGIVTSMDVLRELAGFPRQDRRVVLSPPARSNAENRNG